MNMFVAIFWALCGLCCVLFLATRTALPPSTDPLFGTFQRTYLLVYLLAMAADWMQGPYVYALYEHYGMSTYDINVLFVAGFGSSMVVGTVVGSFADRYGRRTNCILYGALYGLSCVTKHFNSFRVLMVGRVLGGIATSILYSAFESWLLCEHTKRGFNADSVETIFSNAVLGNSIAAIVSGVVAQAFADYFGYVAPFDVSFVVLAVMCVVIVATWTENYGDTKLNAKDTFSHAFKAIRYDSRVFCLGAIQSLFEGSMYTFVLLWTRVLTPPATAVVSSRHLLATYETDGHRGKIPHGYIFAAFMVAMMIGSSLFKLLLKLSSVESFMRSVFIASALALATPIIFPDNRPLVYLAFIVFEICVGIFWPSMGTMRSRYVPEASRATVMNIFRIPLNLIVIVILIQGFSDTVVFQCCTVFLLIAAVTQHAMYRMIKVQESSKKEVANGVMKESLLTI